MIKIIIKTKLFISIFSLFLSLPSFSMDDFFELDVGQYTTERLRKIPAKDFKKSYIKLNNINSDTKFFAVKQQLLGAIHEMIFTGHRPAPFIIKRIEYTYSEGEKKNDWQGNVNNFMQQVADGIEVVHKGGAKSGECIFDFGDVIPNYKYYDINVIRNNERVESSEEAIRSLLRPKLLGNLNSDLRYPDGTGIYEQTIDLDTGETGWISAEEGEEDSEEDK